MYQVVPTGIWYGTGTDIDSLVVLFLSIFISKSTEALKAGPGIKSSFDFSIPSSAFVFCS